LKSWGGETNQQSPQKIKKQSAPRKPKKKKKIKLGLLGTFVDTMQKKIKCSLLLVGGESRLEATEKNCGDENSGGETEREKNPWGV